MESIDIRAWALAALVRSVKTAAQAAVAAIGSAAVIQDVDWRVLAGTVALSFVLSWLTSLAGVPEVDGGKSPVGLDRKE